jgi:hypothetical protein
LEELQFNHLKILKNKESNMSAYIFNVIGEDSYELPYLHKSTISRIKAYAIAIHIPVIIWFIVSFLIAKNIFHLSLFLSFGISFFASSLIYLLERLVLASPKGFGIALIRIILGLAIGYMGAKSVDLVIFNKEIVQQLKVNSNNKINNAYNQQILTNEIDINNKYQLWQNARQASIGEADGTGGTKIKNVGPIFKQKAEYAETLRLDYIKTKDAMDALIQTKNKEISESISTSVESAGLLNQIEALEDFLSKNKTAKNVYWLFFIIIMAFELSTIYVKSCKIKLWFW